MLAWSWLDIMGSPLMQDNGSCTIAACLMCLDAQHRLAFERQHGVDTFAYHIPAETAEDLLGLCKGCGVWTEDDGADEGNVLEVLRITGGAKAASYRPGWEPHCTLQVKSWEKMFNFAGMLPAFSIAYTMHTKGPLLGSFIAGQDYYADGWESRVYRGGSGEEAEPHVVVCFGYVFDNGEMHVTVIDNHRLYGPLRWILYDAFTTFTRIEVEPLDAGSLRKEHKTSWWRGLLGKLRRTKQQPAWRLWRYLLSEIWKMTERDFLSAKPST
ncbi:uncharacterized protein LOC119365328 [Triticum dicoccoides]|uniref:uncharacterized protein LOC119365328 n=1 Tax=Triticum dicoccoides TaxID=85692 RepID=UPI0018902F8B|nr:uncharacterized protein LOC119365328 [Triticum dicoccoides]